MAATEDKLRKLHELVADSFINRIEDDINDNLPTDAATLAAAAKFLKDNNVSADPVDNGQLDELRKKMTERSAANKNAQASNIVALADRLKSGTE